jgi:hypothetical protein
LEQADDLIVIVSENSFKSQWGQREFAAIALQDISKRERRITPVRIDRSPSRSWKQGREGVPATTRDFFTNLGQISQEKI